jgi:hypothetical protein
MSSVNKTYANTANVLTNFVPIKSLVYSDSTLGHVLLVPFSYNNGVLDVLQQDGFIPSNGLGTDNGFSWRMVRAIGGFGVVNKLGSNFLTWFENYTDVDPGSEVLYVAPIMTKVAQCVNNGSSILNSQYAVSGANTRSLISESPTSDQFTTGYQGNNWSTVWVFKSPLTIQYTSGGNGPYYATFYSQFTNPQ